MLLMIFSAAFVGYGTVQLLQNFLRESTRNPMLSEPSNREETSPSEDTPTDSSSEEQEDDPSLPSQLEKPILDLELDSPTVIVPTIPLEQETIPPEQEASLPEPSLEQVPIFSTGVPKTQIIETLGEPTSMRRGYWENTQSVAYQDYVAGKLDLEFIFDRDTGKLRQTEASFASSVELTLIEGKLQQMLQGQITPEIREALAQVYRQETDLRSFAIADWEGMIQRQQGNRIVIRVWEKELR